MLRNNGFDNAKFLMILLVVFGHLIEPIISSSQVINTTFKFIYSFHMPVFIILAGAFTSLNISKNTISKNIRNLIVPFLVFTILYEVFNFLGKGSISNYTLNLQPHWILWFLLSLFIWKISLPLIMQFKFPLSISIAISLCAGYFDDIGYFLGVSRTIYFFPFFILGYKLGTSFLSNNLLSKVPRAIYVLILIANFGLFWLFDGISHKWLYGSFSYVSLGYVEWHSFLIRAILYFSSLTSSIAILMLMPGRESVMSTRGQNSLYVYLWHGFIVKIAMYFGLMQTLANVSSLLALVILFAFSILITALLSTNSITVLTNRFLVTPAQNLLLVKN